MGSLILIINATIHHEPHERIQEVYSSACHAILYRGKK